MRWPIGAERGLGSGKGVQSSDKAVLISFSLLSLSHDGTLSPPGVASPSLAGGLANQQFAVLFCLALTKALEVAQG